MPRVILSLLDRLTLDSGQEARTKPASLDDLKNSLKRDLEYLLNTPKPAHPEKVDGALRGTIVDYGIPEFIGLDIADADAQTTLAVAIEQTIRAFEPRLSNVSVIPILETNTSAHSKPNGVVPMKLAFRVRAELRYRPVRKRIQFHAFLDSASGRLRPGEIVEDA